MRLPFKTLLSGRAAVKAAAINSAWLLLDKAIRLVGGMVIGLWVARYLAPGSFGTFNTLVAIYGLAMIACGLGIESIIVKYLVKYPTRTPILIGTAIRLRMMAAALVSAGIIAMPFFFTSAESPWLWMVIGITLFGNSILIIRQWFESRVASKVVVVSELVAFVVSSALKLIGIFYQFNVGWFVAVVITETLWGTLGYGIIYLRRYPVRLNSFSWPIARMLIRHSWPLLLSTAAIMVYMKIDQIMVQSLSGNEMAGIYAAAARISEIAYFLPSIVLTSVFPALTTLRKTDASKYTHKLTQLFSGISLVAYIIAIGITLGAPLAVSILYGPQYASAASILAVHIWALLWVCHGTLGQLFILNEKLTKLSLIKDCIAAFMNIGLNLLLIPRLGGIGAAIATFFSYSFTAFWGNLVFPQLRPLFKIQLQGLLLFGLRNPLTYLNTD
jgi:PST family polysaccharide transporter